jgi:hypothetical protein
MADAATSANRTALVDLGWTAGLAGGVGSLATATTLGLVVNDVPGHVGLVIRV